MALGGGTYAAQNKTLPGSYINFASAARASAALSSRGVATMPIELDWGLDNGIFEVKASDLQKNCLKIFGYSYDNVKIKGIRDLFSTGLKSCYFYRLNSDGVKASNTFATAKYSGIRGNDIKIVIAESEDSTVENPLYDIKTTIDTMTVDEQKSIKTAANLAANDYVDFKTDAVLNVTAGTALTNGTNGVVADAAYQTYIDKVESHSFNVLGCLATTDTVKTLLVNFTRRMRDEYGVKFQCVLFQKAADYEGVISVENGLEGATSDPSMVYWATGAQAACQLPDNLTNSVYNGEFAPDVDKTQTTLTDGLNAGKFLFHRVGNQVRVLSDRNTYVSATDEKPASFSENQVVRVLDQIGNDVAAIFNEKYIGKPNNAATRMSLWNDIVKNHKELESIQAIESFNADNVIVEAGETKKSVVVSDYIYPVSALEQLYMTVVIQ